MRFELVGDEGAIGSFTERATALAVAREWLREQRAGDAARTVVLRVLDDRGRQLDEEIIALAL